MRFPWAVAIVLAGMSVTGWGQQKKAFKVKSSSSAAEKAPRSSVFVGKTGGSARASTANSKELQTLEKQAAKAPASSRAAGKKTPALKTVKDKPNPPINLGSGGGGKSGGTANRRSNPYAGRLKQKGGH